MRVINSIKNVSVAMVSYMLAMIMGIVSQAVLVRYLGIEYNGINGLFSNIISMLSIAELGIGSAVVFHLYKPIAEKNEEKIKSLIHFYKIAYRIIAIIIGTVGICIIPFLKGIVGETTIKENIYFLFMLFILDTVFSYLLTYKRSLLYADQKNYIINIVHILYTILLNGIQVYIMIATQNYILYLAIKIAFRILENVIITIITNKMYPYIMSKNIKKVDNDIFKDIMKKIKALLFHKIGGYIVDGTDNIIISKFLGITTVGIYTNYKIILNAISSLISQIFNAITASVGNLLIEESKETVYHTYKKLSLLNFFIYYISSSILYIGISLIVQIIYGENYLISQITVFVIMLNFYMQGMKKNIQLFKEAACIFHEDRYIPLVEAGVNLLFSIILAKKIGLIGVILGTIISSLVVFLYSYPKYVFKKVVDKEEKYYVIEQIKYMIIFLLNIGLLSIIENINVVSNVYIKLIINLILATIISLGIFVIIYHNTDEYKYYKDFIFNIFKRIIKRNEKKKEE